MPSSLRPRIGVQMSISSRSTQFRGGTAFDDVFSVPAQAPAAVHFAVCGKRHTVKLHHILWNHIVGKRPGQQGSNGSFFNMCACIIRTKDCFLSFFCYDDCRFPDSINFSQARFDFGRLNPLPANLELAVDTADVSDASIRRQCAKSPVL